MPGLLIADVSSHITHGMALMNVEQRIDPTVMVESACGDRELVIELIDLYFELARESMEPLENYIASGNALAVLAFAHKLAGSSVACGLIGLAYDLRELEELCKQGMPTDIGERVKSIEQQISDARVFWTGYLGGDSNE